MGSTNLVNINRILLTNGCDEVMKCWSAGVLEFWSSGVLVCWCIAGTHHIVAFQGYAIAQPEAE